MGGGGLPGVVNRSVLDLVKSDLPAGRNVALATWAFRRGLGGGAWIWVWLAGDSS